MLKWPLLYPMGLGQALESPCDNGAFGSAAPMDLLRSVVMMVKCLTAGARVLRVRLLVFRY